MLKNIETTNKIIEQIIDQYSFYDKSNRPWVIGFSGGKDSTLLLHFVWLALLKISKDFTTLKREVFVICNDTLVENPIIEAYVNKILKEVETAAQKQNLPIKVSKTTPSYKQSFFVNVIGRGYPVPNQNFRWCTTRMKINPTSSFIKKISKKDIGAIILLGTRKDESQSRKAIIEKHYQKGKKRLSPHPLSPFVFTFAPIKDISTEELWFYLHTEECPWGSDYSQLGEIYSNASADDYECPTAVTDKKHKSCGNSRFGCWTCTLVKEDKSMKNLINNGNSWLNPLFDFRNKLIQERNDKRFRSSKRRNGNEAQSGLGVYKLKYRQHLLEELLTLQKNMQKKQGKDFILIHSQELNEIQNIWNSDLADLNKVQDIYDKIYFNKKLGDIMGIPKKEKDLLKEVGFEESEITNIEKFLEKQSTDKSGLKDYIKKQEENNENI